MIIVIAILISLLLGLFFGYGVSLFDQGGLFIMAAIIFVLGAIALVFRPQLRTKQERKPEESGTTPEAGKFHLTVEENNFLVRIFFIALTIRIAVAVLFIMIDSDRKFDGDGNFSERAAFLISEFWHGRGPGWYMTKLEGRELGFHYINAIIFFIFGKSVLLPKLFNAIIGSLVPILIYKIASVCFDWRVARLSAWLIVIFPSMITWSSLNVKDMYVIFLMLIVVFQAIKLRDQVTISSVLIIIASLTLMRTMRNYLPFLLIASLGLSFLVLSRKNVLRNYILGLFLLLAIVFQARLSGFQIIAKESLSIERVYEIRKGMSRASKSAAYYSDIDISDPGKALVYLPIGVAYFLFSPFPWAIDPDRIRQVMSIPEIFIWYLCVPSLLRGLWHGFKHNFKYSSILLSVIVTLTLAYSLAEGNVGTAFRHRAQVMVFLIIFVAVGWIKKRGGGSSPLHPKGGV